MTLRDELAGLLHGAVTIVGIGNPARGDDAFGSRLARALAGTVGAAVVDAEDVPESYLLRVIAARPDVVLFLDAVDLGEAPGTIALFHAEELSLYQPSTHRMPLAMLMEIVEREAGARVALLAVQPSHTELGGPPGPEVSESLACLTELLVDLLPRRRSAAGVPTGVEGAASW